MEGLVKYMKYGHFDNQKREYVIDRIDLPTSWTNYLGVENLAAVVNHTAISQNQQISWKQYSGGQTRILYLYP